MSPLTRNQTIWASVIGAVAVIGAALVTVFGPTIIHVFTPDKKTAYINGVVSDAFNKEPMSGVVILLQTNEGKPITQDTSDGAGKFNLRVPADVTAVRLSVSVGGYAPYDVKLPAQDAKNDITLVRQHIIVGIPDGTPLQIALDTLAGDLNITAVFANACSKAAKVSALNGGQLEGDPRAIDEMLKDLLTRVKDNNRRYGITTIEVGKRYEVRCS